MRIKLTLTDNQCVCITLNHLPLDHVFIGYMLEIEPYVHYIYLK
jgi:hypothetical protein